MLEQEKEERHFLQLFNNNKKVLVSLCTSECGHVSSFKSGQFNLGVSFSFPPTDNSCVIYRTASHTLLVYISLLTSVDSEKTIMYVSAKKTTATGIEWEPKKRKKRGGRNEGIQVLPTVSAVNWPNYEEK